MDDDYAIDNRLVECKCPVCQRTYMRMFWWTGNGMPRKYCPTCKQSRIADKCTIMESAVSRTAQYTVGAT